jgi:lysozyme
VWVYVCCYSCRIYAEALAEQNTGCGNYYVCVVFDGFSGTQYGSHAPGGLFLAIGKRTWAVYLWQFPMKRGVGFFLWFFTAIGLSLLICLWPYRNRLPLLVKGKSRINEKVVTTRYPSFGVNVPGGYSLLGMDVSAYQGNINWELVSKMSEGNKEIRFVYIRSSMGKNRNDKRFIENWSGAEKVNLLRGAYHYFDPRQGGKEQAKHFLSRINQVKGPGELPPVLDVEEIGSLSVSGLQREVTAFISEVEKKLKVKVILYAGVNFYLQKLHQAFSSTPLWVAHYTYGKPRLVGRNWDFWQFTDKGRVNGISEPVDLNVFNGTWNELKTFRKASGLKVP